MNYVLILFAISLVIVLIWKIPYWNLKAYKNKITKYEILYLVNENRKTVAQIIVGIGFIIGLGFSWNQVTSIKESGILSERMFIRESFNDAILHIGNKESQVRLGGIFSLHKLTNESSGYTETIIQILSTYIRQHCNDSINGYLSEEIQAAIDVITKNEKISSEKISFFNFNDIILNKYNFNNSELSESKLYNSEFIDVQFVEANFEKAKAYTTTFYNCNFYCANLKSADFTGAVFYESHLAYTDLSNVFASKSDFIEVNLENANLSGGDFSESKFHDSNLRGTVLYSTNLCGANLKTVKGLTYEQIKYAKIDSRTILPNFN